MARLLRSVRHLGGSFLPGENLCHFWVRHPPCDQVHRLWSASITDAGLGGDLVIGPALPDGTCHLHAPLSLFVPLTVADRLVTGRPPDVQGRQALQVAGWSEASDQAAFRHHHEAALARGLPSLRGFLGAMPVTLVGIGRHARLFGMNMGPNVSPIAALAGANKATGRSLLSGILLGIRRRVGQQLAGDFQAWCHGRADGFPDP